MDAWIDCMSDLDNQDGLRLSKMGCSVGEIVVLQLKYATDFAARQERLFQELLDCVSFVNWRRNEEGRMAILALSYCK